MKTMVFPLQTGKLQSYALLDLAVIMLKTWRLPVLAPIHGFADLLSTEMQI